MMTLTDAGPLIALIDADEQDHEACLQALDELAPRAPVAAQRNGAQGTALVVGETHRQLLREQLVEFDAAPRRVAG